MPDINITVAHKVAVCDTPAIVCDNSDYTVHWTLDDEWSAYDTKTMRTIYMDGTYTDTVFSGADIALPVCTVPGAVQIGLFAGDIRTSRVAIMRALPSVRSAAGAPADPTPDVYDQLMERMAQLENPDWAQNDPTAKDYVKNRTHYVSRESVVLVPEQEVTTAFENNSNVAVLNDVDLDALNTLYNSEDDTTFDVVFDGTSYQCKWFEQGGPRMPIFGNSVLVNPSMPDTCEPFCITPGGNPDVGETLAIRCKVAGTHTVAVSYQQDVVHTLDPKYIKDMYHAETVETGEAGPFAWAKSTGATTGAGSLDGYNLVIPKMSIRATIYESVVPSKVEGTNVYYEVGGYTICIKSYAPSMTIEPSDLGSDEVLFYWTAEQITPVPDKYIPDTVAKVADLAGNRQVYTVIESRYTSGISCDSEARNYPLMVCSITGNDSRPYQGKLTSIYYTDLNATVPIYSCKTGKEMTADACPYGIMILAYTSRERWVCLNPL